MKIPKRFKLLGHTVTVAIDKSIQFKEGSRGRCDTRTNEIVIQCGQAWPMPQTETEHTFLHEMTHILLDKMGREDLCGDEKFVELFSGLLHQALTTMEYK